jgi:hypothetical protein
MVKLYELEFKPKPILGTYYYNRNGFDPHSYFFHNPLFSNKYFRKMENERVILEGTMHTIAEGNKNIHYFASKPSNAI